MATETETVVEESEESAQQTPMIEADGLSKFYGIFAATREVSFKVFKGEVVAFLGPNGAGKSTTMNILTGIVSPSEGFVSICGRDLCEDLGEIQSLIGVSPQFDCLWGELTAFQVRNLGVW